MTRIRSVVLLLVGAAGCGTLKGIHRSSSVDSDESDGMDPPRNNRSASVFSLPHDDPFEPPVRALHPDSEAKRSTGLLRRHHTEGTGKSFRMSPASGVPTAKKVLIPAIDEAQSTLPTDLAPNTVKQGILSKNPASFFESIREEIDRDHLEDRCKRYGFGMQDKKGRKQPQNRRIFFGSLIANEPWEMVEIIAAETRDIFHAMVLVESNRTQMFTPRPWLRLNDTSKFQELFGVDKVQIRPFVNEDLMLLALSREHRQRHEILLGWKELGMTPKDIGYIADLDETFTRDFLRAVQTCPYVQSLDYKTHFCDNRHNPKIIAETLVMEGSPQCVGHDHWYHPDMMIGRCIEVIADKSSPHKPAPRSGYQRAKGYGDDMSSNHIKEHFAHINITKGKYPPLWNAADFRMTPGSTYQHKLHAPNKSEITGFHFHNFFADLQALRHTYLTYGHPVENATTKALKEMSDEMELLSQCILSPNNTHPTKSLKRELEPGGFEAVLKPWPIYFYDDDYRRRKHASVQQMVQQDEAQRLTTWLKRQ